MTDLEVKAEIRDGKLRPKIKQANARCQQCWGRGELTIIASSHRLTRDCHCVRWK